MVNPDLSLVELDSLEILVIIDNELDPISASQNPLVTQSGNLKDIAFRNDPIQPASISGTPGEPCREIRMEEICCGAHGLSLLITAVKGDERRTILFDTGPEERAFQLNAERLRAKLENVEVIQLSHWHRDHSGGMLKVLEMIDSARSKSDIQNLPTVDVDLHPDRPNLRGVRPPEMEVMSLGVDPSFDEIKKAGATVSTSSQAHTVLDGMFVVSGEIPRVTEYEKGLKYGVRLADSGKWVNDTMLKDERLLMCKLKDRGIVMFTGCSHAGVVNASRYAVQLGGGSTPLFAVMGGFHLADATQEHIEATASDLKALDTKVLLTGHCTGWRAKFELQKQMPGRLVPSFVGSKFVL